MRTTQQTVAEILTSPKGMLVLDEYAEELVADARPDRFADLVLRTPGLGGYVSAVLLTRPTFAATASLRHALREAGTAPLVGVRMTPPGARASLSALRADLGALAGDDATFVEWRANLAPRDVPRGAAHIEAEALTRGASAAQAEGLLPVLTVAMPDLVSSSIAVSQAVTTNALVALRAQLDQTDVDPGNLLIRVNMVVPGRSHPSPADAAQVARMTVQALRTGVPAEIPGVLLLSGGQPVDQACANLRAIVSHAAGLGVPWRLGHAFSRALVAPAAAAFSAGEDDSEVGRQLVSSCRHASEALRPVQLTRGAAS
jgi:fructose-bisphosphate aldolase class 1